MTCPTWIGCQKFSYIFDAELFSRRKWKSYHWLLSMDEFQFGRLKYSREKQRLDDKKINENVSTIQFVCVWGFNWYRNIVLFFISSLHGTLKPMEMAINAIGRKKNCGKKQKTAIRNEIKWKGKNDLRKSYNQIESTSI